MDEQALLQACDAIDALASDVLARKVVPAGVRGRIYAVLDAMRSEGAPADRVRGAERIALAIHGLEWARLRRSPEQEEALWTELAELAGAWGRAAQWEPMAVATVGD